MLIICVEIIKTIDQRASQKQKRKQKQKTTRGDRSYSKSVRAK